MILHDRLIYTLIVLFLSPSFIFAQMDEDLRKHIEESGFIHKPLTLDYSRSYDTLSHPKKVLDTKVIVDMESLGNWRHTGIGEMRLTEERSKEGKHSVRLVAPLLPENLGEEGTGILHSKAEYNVKAENWEDYNRIHFYVYPDFKGMRSGVYLNMYIENDGAIKIPDEYEREGINEFNLKEGQWNEVSLEISELPRDKVTKLSFGLEVFGKEQTVLVDSMKFDIDAVSLQKIAKPEITSGWIPADNRIIHSTTGYGVDSKKTAIIHVADNKGEFKLVNANNTETVYEGKIKDVDTHIGDFQTVDFSEFTQEGQYYIQVGEVKTQPFYIDKNIWLGSAWRVLNFIFNERCGYAIPQKHGVCHTDLFGVFKGDTIPFNGGWHDAGDMSQQVLQSGDIVKALLEVADKAKQNGNTSLYNRLMEEAKFGIDAILRSRLDDGYRLQTWGTNLWTDGVLGTTDDADGRQVTVYNRAFENFVFSGIEAYSAMAIKDDPALSNKLKAVAEEDYAYAKKRFDRLGFADIDSIEVYGGHASMASNSQYAANRSYAASLLYKLTEKDYYAQEAAAAIEYTLQTQRTAPLAGEKDFAGFFYRDLDKVSIVHYNHQSRDQVFIQALVALAETQPAHDKYDTWKRAIKQYGNYLKNIAKYDAPYGLVPSGIYNINEVKDSANFYKVQPFISSDKDMVPEYEAQLKNGTQLDNEHYLRIFPVWYSFRGNTAVQLATGKAAAIAARFLGDEDLLNLAEEQLFWNVGKNPFGQSLIWGEGSNYPQLYNALLGETVGEIPVGIKTRGNEDVPYWPNFNFATFKEVWGAPAAKWLSLISEF